MTKFDVKKLYELLSSVYRLRDTAIRQTNQGTGLSETEIEGPLRALLSIIADEVAVIEENLDQLYDDQFIETCAEWVVPYIGQLIGTRSLVNIPDSDFSQRSEVANTITYRRRKGTASVIEQLARDVTAWDANVVEYFQKLATTQYLNHLRPKNIAVVSIRNRKALERLNTPFNTMPHTVDVRRVESRRGKYNIPNIGIYLWRIKNYASTQSIPFKVDDRRYTFDPFGKDIPLYNQPIPEETITQLAERINVSAPIGRGEFARDLETYYGKQKSVLLYIDGLPYLPKNASTQFAAPPNPPVINLEKIICVCNLSDVFDEANNLTTWANMPQSKIAIDPVLGRIALPPSDVLPNENIDLKVTYHYGFSSEIGGGEYDRSATFSLSPNSPEKIEANASIQAALNELQETSGIIQIEDNLHYEEPLEIQVAEGHTIELRAADNKRPILKGGVRVSGDGQLIINGLILAEGDIEVTENAQFLLIHSTILPTSDSKIKLTNSNTSLEIKKSIVGQLSVEEGAKVSIEDSIVDATDPKAIAYAGTTDETAGGILQIKNSTIIGSVYTKTMELASNTIFIADPTTLHPIPVKAERLQKGCVRFSYFPSSSTLPSPYRCQPTDENNIRPTFNSLTYDDPTYCQLSPHCAKEIREGADDEAEMGAFHHLYQPQRVNNLRVRLNEYLRFGLEAGIFFAS